MPYNMHVISHTHWDREWYLTYQQFRMRLVDLVDNLLDILDSDPEFKYFNFDGQTIVLEDYLQIKPDRREKIEKYVCNGRILIGPWYQLNDEFLVSGESTVRSLLIGHRISREFGATMKLGHVPDQFGNISQLPQILNGFGIDTVIFGRGLDMYQPGRKMENWWQSPDGSKVLSSLMGFWYCNAQHFPADTNAAVEYTNAIRDLMVPYSASKELLLMNGVDHLEAQPDVGQIINRIGDKLGDDKIMHSTLVAYMDALKADIDENNIKLDTVTGELREGNQTTILSGVLSTRIYLKQANQACQTALEKYAEPLAAFASTLGTQYPKEYLTYAWKLLMQNHPHDSICGCSLDQVHREMMPRFEQVQQVADELMGRSLKSIACKVKTDSDSLIVVNTLNWERTDRVQATIDFALSDPDRSKPILDPERAVEAIRLVDDKGNKVPLALISTRTFSDTLLRPDELPMLVITKRFEIEFVAENVPQCGYKAYKIEKCDKLFTWKESLASEAYSDTAIANEFLRLSIRGGSVCLERLGGSEDSPVQDFFANINSFEDVGDVGDEYLHYKPQADVVVTSLGSSPQVSIIDHSSVSATMKLDYSLAIPSEALADRSGRSVTTVECPITTYLTLTRGVPRVDVRTVVDNKAADHRLRVLFPSGVETDVSHADGQYVVIERPIAVPAQWPDAAPFHPQQGWVDVCDGERGLCIINKGLPEYEVYNDAGRTVAVTLLRCVGCLSCGADMPGNTVTPDAQCIGEYSFEYSIYPHSGDWKSAQVWKQAQQHNVPLAVVQTGAHDGQLPVAHSFVEVSHPELVVSAIKKAEDSDILAVRLYNTTDEAISDAWVKVNQTKTAQLLNLNEERVGEVTFADSTARLSVGVKKIVTLGFGI